MIFHLHSLFVFCSKTNFVLGVNGYLRQTTATGAPPLVNPGVFAHNLKLADERAKWMSRRVFADAERERSREHARWKQHQQKVSKFV